MSEFTVPTTLNLSDNLCVFSGTLYGEIRGGTQEAMQDVAQVILNRQKKNPSQTIAQICLAREQFSCWNLSDPNREKILTAPVKDPETWRTVCLVAYNAMGGNNPDRIGGACNYYAISMKIAPPWARPPSVITFQDGFHAFVKTPW